MSVDQLDVVDIISTDSQTGRVVLTITDHLDWSNSIWHQEILQSKFNAYLAFVESGRILSSYPDAKNRPIEFRVVFKFPPDIGGKRFLGRAQKVIESAGFSFGYEIFATSYDN